MTVSCPVGGEEPVPTIALDTLDPTPKYLQILRQIKAHVAAGRLQPGTMLPSVRQLAGDLGINVNTVLAAYRVLEAEHVVSVRRGAGVVVRPLVSSPETPATQDVAHIRERLEQVYVDAILAGVSQESLRALANEVWDRPPGHAGAEVRPAGS